MLETGSEPLIAVATIERAASMLRALAPRGSDVILFGSYARGDAGPESDVDFLVVEPTLQSRHAEMVRLRQALRPLGIPVDVLVVSRGVFDEWKVLPNNVIYEANLEGKAMARHRLRPNCCCPRRGKTFTAPARLKTTRRSRSSRSSFYASRRSRSL